MKINAEMSGAYVFSSGKNMGAFKAVGFPEDVGVFYKLEEYEGYSWTAHGRYPTNTPGWWGGAHPFTLLDYSVVHNVEISFAKNAAAFFRNAISFRNSSFSRFNRRFSFIES